MHRLAPALLIGGALLLATSLGAPAAPTPAPTQALQLMDAQGSAVLAEVNAQVDRLRDRLRAPAEPPAPDRDPFNFGLRPLEPIIVDAPESVDDVPAPPLPRILPRIIAIVTDTLDGAIVRHGFVAFDGDVLEVREGDRIGPFVVRSVLDGAIELEDGERAMTHRITVK